MLPMWTQNVCRQVDRRVWQVYEQEGVAITSPSGWVGEWPNRIKNRRFFFLNGELHRRLYVHKGRDTILAWNYPRGEEVKYLYSDWVRRHEKAYTTAEVGAMIGRHRTRVNHWVQKGELPPPAASYSLDDKVRVPRYYFSETQVMQVHEFFCGIQRGVSPVDDAPGQNESLTPRSEVQRMLAGDNVLYKKDKSGNLVPVWKVDKV